MITTITNIGGSNYEDYSNLEIIRALSENNKVGTFNILMDSPYGRHKSDFTPGNDVKIYAGNGVISNLEAQWRLAEPSGIKSYDEIGSNHGTINSGTKQYFSPIGNYSAKMTGSLNASYIDIGSIKNKFPAESGTISIWFNPQASALSDSGFVIFQAGSRSDFTIGGNSEVRIRTNIFGANNIEFLSQMSGNIIINLAKPGTANIGSWNHVAATWAGTNNYSFIYLNGTLLGSVQQTGSISRIDFNKISWGGRETLGNTYFWGNLSDGRIYNRPLNSNEITTLFNNRSGTLDLMVFRGILDNMEFVGQELDQKVNLRGRDYMARLLDNKIEPTVYTNTEVGSIVKDIIKNNLTDIGSNYVQSTTTNLKRIAFNQTPIFDAIKQLSDFSNYSFYTDAQKELHFEFIGSDPVNKVLGSDSIIRLSYNKTREGMANKIWVYGDRYLAAAPTENLSVGSPSVGGNLGSVFTLTFFPHNTQISILGTIRKGGIYQLENTPSSGNVYLVNFEDKQLIFPSGTTFGYYLPSSGGSIIADYDRSLPIVKYAEDRPSISSFGAKTLVITDKSIKDPNTAVDILNEKLLLTQPINNIEVEMKGWHNINPGQNINVEMGDFNLSTSGLPIIEVNYNLTPETALNEKIISLKLENRQIDLTDKIRDLKKKIDALEAQDKSSADFFTRLEYATGSMLIVGSYWELRTRFMGSSFVLNDVSIGSLVPAERVALGRLGSQTGSLCFLGDSRGPLTVQISGGYSYG